MKARGNQPDGREDMYSSTHWHAPTHEKIHAYHKKNTIWKKLAVSVAAVATAIGGVTVTTSAAQAATNRDSYADTVENSTFQAARAKYGLAEQMSEGATLHAWEWSFKTIEQHIPEIAAAGYTSVQTEPISAIHTGNKGKIFTENWYYVYQPTDTTIGNWVMGSESDLKSLCATAHKYGVRIIVDVVANHMTATWNAIADRWKKSDLYHHDCNDGDVQDYNNRYQVTHCKLLSLYDINTSKTETANMMHDYLVQAVNDGVDGFRFDAAKHIELPNEYDGSQYWNIVLNNGAQFQYGEVLQDSISHDADYAKLFANNSRHGGGVTASYYGVKLRGALSSKNLNAGNLNNWDNAAGGNNLVSWVESHDNYSNKPDDYGASMKMSEWEMTMGWGVIGSRSQTMPLYFDRPVGSGGNQPQFAEKSQLGDAGSDSWKDSQVVAVNHFRNKMNNAKAKEYMRNCGDNSCLMVERYIKDGNADSDGVTVVNMNGDKSLAGTETTLDDGTYTDQVNGGTLTVSGGKITSGTAKGGKISVFYNSNLASVSANPTGGSFKTDTTKVTLHASNVTSASYTTSEGSSGSYQDGDTIAIGAKTAVNGTITLKLQGTDKDGKTVSAEYTFTKKDPAAVSVAYAKKPSNWSNLYAYVYVDDSSAATLKQNAKWPGVAMTKVSAGDSCGKDGEYKYEIPDGFDENVRIIFNDGNATNTLKYPADTAEGEDAAGLSIDGTYAWNGDTTASGTWTARSCAVVTVNSVKINQKDFTTDLTNGAKTIKLTATTDPAGVNVSWSSSNEAVAKVASDGTVTPVKAGTAKITAKAGGKSASITVTVTGVPPLDPVEKNTIYATKPSGWGDLYAYVYTGDGATAANNAAWPGVKMTATTASDGCRQSNAYRYAVPDDLSKDAKVIFNDGGSQQFPGSREPGIAYDGGIVKWDGATAALPALDCPTDVPVTSVSISGPGVKDGKATVRKGASLQLAATVSPGNATDRTVAWKSGDTAVATVDKAGKVTGVKAGKATITATAGGKSASVEVTVEEPQTTVQITFRAAADLKAGETLYAVGDWGQGKGKIWNRAGGVRLAGADGSYTGTTTVAKGHSVTARLVKVTADGKTEWDKIGDVKATADSSKTVSLKWDENAGKTVGITINAAADLKAGETLYAVGDWGQGKGKIWNRAGGVRLAQSGSIYTGTAKVDRNHAMTFRLIKVDASGRTTWDPTTDRKTTADKTKSIGVTWSINKVNEDGSIPDGNEFYITGKGVENGKLTMQAHHLAELNLVGASTSDKVTWWSDSAAVAVSGTGTVYAVQKGAAKVSAKVGTKIASVDVTVEDNSVNKVSSVTIAGDGVSNGKLSIVAGKNIQLNATVLPENATNKTVSWTSSNSSVVNVMGTGVLTTAKAGTATITATADGVSAKVAVTVTAAPNPFNDDIVIAGAESGKVIGSEQFQLTAREKDGSSFANVEWSIPDTNLLMFINKGFSKTTTGRTVGLKAQYDLSRHDYVDTVISVKATRTDGTVLTAQKKISVGGSDSVSDSDPLDSLTPSADGLTKTGDNEYTITIPAGSSKHVSVTALPSNARQLPLWKELGGDDTVATVDADGTIYAHKAGTFATSVNNYNRYFQLTVVVE